MKTCGPSNCSEESSLAKSGKLLDIVIAHHSEWNEGQVRTFWEEFLNLPKVAVLALHFLTV